MKVVLGPRHDLHVGIHGALRSAPPPGVEYVERPYDLRFLHPAHETALPFSPAHDYAFAEWVRFRETGGHFDLVHSSRLPVETSQPWVVDADSLVLPLEVGSFYALASPERAAAIGEDEIRLRASFMLSRYLQPRCSSILFRTRWGRQELLEYIDRRGLLPPAGVEELAGKCRVVHPAVSMMLAHDQRRESGDASILYVGRTFEDKGGLVAAAALLKLGEREQTRFRASFVGPCPEPLALRLRAAGVQTHPVLERDEYLRLLGQCNVFLSPSAFESYGMALVEAAAAGTAIVCSSGPGMEAVAELLEEGRNALFVSNALPLHRRVAAVVDALASLIHDHDLRRRLQTNNRATTTRGALSIGRRNDALLAAYDDALASPSDAAAAYGREEAVHDDAFRVTDWSQALCEWELRRRAPGAIRIRLGPGPGAPC